MRSIGGFTGPAGAEERVIDVATLDREKAEHVEQLVADLRKVAEGGTFVKPAPQSWDFMHTVVIEEDGRPNETFRFHSDAAPATLRELFDELNDSSA